MFLNSFAKLLRQTHFEVGVSLEGKEKEAKLFIDIGEILRQSLQIFEFKDIFLEILTMSLNLVGVLKVRN